jgi:hypothetical protein
MARAQTLHVTVRAPSLLFYSGTDTTSNRPSTIVNVSSCGANPRAPTVASTIALHARSAISVHCADDISAGMSCVYVGLQLVCAATVSRLLYLATMPGDCPALDPHGLQLAYAAPTMRRSAISLRCRRFALLDRHWGPRILVLGTLNLQLAYTAPTRVRDMLCIARVLFTDRVVLQFVYVAVASRYPSQGVRTGCTAPRRTDAHGAGARGARRDSLSAVMPIPTGQTTPRLARSQGRTNTRPHNAY